MPRQKPRRKGKPLKTEPGAIQIINKNDQTEQSQMHKLDQIE